MVKTPFCSLLVSYSPSSLLDLGDVLSDPEDRARARRRLSVCPTSRGRHGPENGTLAADRFRSEAAFKQLMLQK